MEAYSVLIMCFSGLVVVVGGVLAVAGWLDDGDPKALIRSHFEDKE